MDRGRTQPEQQDQTVWGINTPRRSPIVQVDEYGFYTDETGTKWATLNAFYENLSTDSQDRTTISALRRYANANCKHLPAYDRWERPGAKVYPVNELEALAIMSNEIRVDANGFYSDENKTRWASSKTWAKHYRISMKPMNDAITKSFGAWDEVPYLKGFGKAKREDHLYPEDEIVKAISHIIDAENSSIDEIVTVLKDNGDSVEEVVYATTRGFVKIIPEDIIPRYKYRRLFEEQRVDSVDRRSGGLDGAFEVQAVVDHFRDQIQDILAGIEDAPEEAAEDNNLVSISQYINENAQADRVKLKRNLDKAERHMRKTKDGKIGFLYSRTQLDEIAKAA